MRRLRLALLWLALAAAAAGGAAACSSDGPGTQSATAAGSPPAAAGSRTLQYDAAELTGEQRSALSELASDRMVDGRVPPDVGMVAVPQPPGQPPDAVVVALQHASCGGTEELGELHLDGTTLVIEVRDKPMKPGELCAGMVQVRGLRVELPDGAVVKEVRIEHRRP